VKRHVTFNPMYPLIRNCIKQQTCQYCTNNLKLSVDGFHAFRVNGFLCRCFTILSNLVAVAQNGGKRLCYGGEVTPAISSCRCTYVASSCLITVHVAWMALHMSVADVHWQFHWYHKESRNNCNVWSPYLSWSQMYTAFSFNSDVGCSDNEYGWELEVLHKQKIDLDRKVKPFLVLPPSRNTCRHWLLSTTLTVCLIQKIVQL
jgi:hypothetical protein